MQKQTRLFDTATIEKPRPSNRYIGVPHNGTETSRAAAESVAPVVNAMNVAVFLVIARENGATDQECQEQLGMDGNSQRPRRYSLEKAELVEPSGEYRPTRTGRKARVYCATQLGRELLAPHLSAAAEPAA